MEMNHPLNKAREGTIHPILLHNILHEFLLWIAAKGPDCPLCQMYFPWTAVLNGWGTTLLL